ncbi:AATF family protein [Aspergillus homomorphus CBS 101889]|uniref:Protein BFR2 n=1 Tax=Aspergillus homomorphus (strain CBS 101889) TaxID=1450537 RepID=A0A395HG12_ASPHC|nr:TRAUB-domain-containing protein [Aspergillus homomorphus CBS 101889]RAL06842.1 TRAUB-domain-containing protein [Aspergillus homomorphus CBS 101889]
MAPKSLAEQLAELEDPTPRDFDPEDLDRGDQDSEDEGGNAGGADAGREHYQAVGKGKLRKQDPIALGKQYAGSKVSREALEADSDDDPFKARSSDEDDDEEDEEDDDEDLELGSDEDDEDISDESEEETAQPAKKAGKKGKREVDFDDMDTDESDELEGSEDEDEDEFPSDSDDDEDSDEEEDSDASDNETPNRRVKFDDSTTKKSDDREELRKLMASDQKTIAATISQAAKADATKGKAVKQQRATFDALLNTRIKLQKGLTAIHQLTLAVNQPKPANESTENTEAAEAEAEADTDSLDGEAIKSAESAALALWSTLEDLRLALADAHHTQQQDDKKRKRPAAVTPGTSSASLWKRMTALEAESLAHRRAVLDKWSQKVRGANAPARGSKLIASSGSGSQTISAVLDAQVATETAGIRAVKRARTTSSSANGDSTSTTKRDVTAAADDEQQPLYDDTVFYQSLLRELVEQRMSSSDAISNGLDSLHLQLPSRLSAVHPVTGMRNDKVKRDVDTRASKGRKMKFDVHEKLQNFMAPEDRGSWTGHAREEFFASLLGNTASGLLREGEDEEDAVDEESDADREEGGLRLFRN